MTTYTKGGLRPPRHRGGPLKHTGIMVFGNRRNIATEIIPAQSL